MEITKTMKAGSDGTKTFTRHYGERLVCVRHRLDVQAGRRLTTVELIVNERPVRPGFKRIRELEEEMLGSR